ncbi:MAG: SpoVA/SpoVAEb family sporulation membrane protein [Clostridiales bacterium]|nr:SpoVA/SpoVAEb family sporulation membrane protein [Clostridiales bacterium]
MWWELILKLLLVFISGGLLCVLAEILIIKTTLTPAKILVIFLIAGIVLETFGIYKPLLNIFNAGVSVPIVGFGAGLAEGAIKYATEYGFIGAFAGGLLNTAFGVGVAVVVSYIITLIFSPKTKK